MMKITNVKAIGYVLENCDLPDEVVEKLEKIKVSFEKKSGGARKPSARQLENEDIKACILDYMEEDVKYLAGELMKNVPRLIEIDASIQKVTALMKQLIESGQVEKIVDKRKSYFQKV